jgi:hypothetical protein
VGFVIWTVQAGPSTILERQERFPKLPPLPAPGDIVEFGAGIELVVAKRRWRANEDWVRIDFGGVSAATASTLRGHGWTEHASV